MTRRDILKTAHEPFGDAWYYGPERLNDRYEDDIKARNASGFSDATYRDIFESLERDNPEVRFSLHSSYVVRSLSLLYFTYLAPTLRLTIMSIAPEKH